MQVSATEYHIRSTEYLKLLADNNCYLLLERSAPAGRMKRDFISIKYNDGRNLELRTPRGYKVSPVELPRTVFDDFIRASFIKQDGPEGVDGSTTYRLTNDGRERGRM
jgi:hypothetical protein